LIPAIHHTRQAVRTRKERFRLIQFLRESEERYRSTVESLHDMIFYVDEKGIFRDFFVPPSQELKPYLPPEEFLGKSYRKVLPPHLVKQITAAVDQIRQGSRTVEFRYSLEVDKKTHWYRATLTGRYDGDRFRGVTGVVKDITEQLAVEEQNRILSQGFQQSPVMVVVTDRRWRVEYCNPRFTEVTGYSQDEALGKTMLELLEGDPMAPEEVEKIEAVIRHGQTWEGRFHNRRKDGSMYWERAILSPILDANDKLMHILHLKQDITDQVETQERLERNEQRFRAVVEHSNDGMYVLKGQRFLFVNRRFEEMTGYRSADVTRKDFRYEDMLTEAGKEVFRQRREAFRQGKTVSDRFTFQSRTKDGDIKYFEASISRLNWDGVAATLGMLRDVTDMVVMQQELEEALKLAQQGEEIKRLFLANMSHEIRTPLNAIIGFTDLLQQTLHDRLSAEEQTFFNEVLKSGNRLIHTVHEILDMSQIEAGSFPVHPEPFNLTETLKGVFLANEAAARSKQLEFTLSLPEEDVMATADPMCVQRALENLMDNAIKYTTEGRVTVTLGAKGNTPEIVIEDTGIGMSEEYLARAFEPFSQESEGYTKKFQGVGLGLSLTKKYLELNSIDLAITSRKGVGTMVKITFPPEKKTG
ncbi:MAG: PAS domain-containing sensor histidine kinase, partial [Candidatus Neomarinimicrobiota bacterium]